VSEGSDEEVRTARLAYFLLLLAVPTGGLTALVGVALAYAHRARAPAWLVDHFTWQIRTFWLALLYAAIGAVLAPVLVGFVVLAAALVWYVVRCALGYRWLERNTSPRDVETWLV
jgi:uncharacterized membrane protein